MTSYEETKVKPIRRSIILRFLERSQDYISNAEILVSVINGTRDGVTAYYADIVGDLAWLETKGYVTLSGEDIVTRQQFLDLTGASDHAGHQCESDAKPFFHYSPLIKTNLNAWA